MKKLDSIAPQNLIKVLKKLDFEEIRQKDSNKFFRDSESRIFK